MTIKDDPTLEDALDGLQNAERYCFENGLDYVGHVIASAYQAVGSDAPDEHWVWDTKELQEEIENYEMSDERIREIQETLRKLDENDDTSDL